MTQLDPSSLLLAAGIGLAVSGLAWRRFSRSRDRSRVRRSLDVALRAGDAAVRSSAIAAAGAQGLSTFADLLLRCAASETDPSVIRTLAATVARQQWEPMDTPAVVELRLWAHRHEASPQTPTPQAPPTPILPAPRPHGLTLAEWPPAVKTAQVAPPAIETPAAHSNGNGTGNGSGRGNGKGLAVVTMPVSRRIARSDAPTPSSRGNAGLRGATIIVTGAGGPAGVAVIRALDGHGVRVIGVDADGLAAGLRLADEGAVIPRADDPRYAAELVALARRTHATALVCTVAEEMGGLARAEYQLRDVGVAIWIPSAAALQACLDKWRFVQVMHQAGVRVPATSLESVDRVPGPWIVKPRFGRGSRDVYTADDSRDLAWALRRVDQPIVQTRVTGREFTVDALVDPHGVMVGAVPRWRLETKAGISTKGRTFSDDVLVGRTEKVLTAVGLTGPANVQGFVDEAGMITFIEVNPRFSGGLPLSIAAGADLVGEYLRGMLGQPIHPERLTYRSGVTMIRHFEEVFES
jgi:carbamoyl-phosphate synthase large subunit